MAVTVQTNRSLKQHELWVSHYIRCLAFHEEPNFERIKFEDAEKMWSAVFQYLDRGYCVG